MSMGRGFRAGIRNGQRGGHSDRLAVQGRVGVVRVLISETSEAVKPDQAATASLTAGPVTAKVRGRTTANEEAGVPSFSGTLRPFDRLLAALSKAPLLVFTVGPSRHQVPSAEIGDKASKLIGQCAKR